MLAMSTILAGPNPASALRNCAALACLSALPVERRVIALESRSFQFVSLVCFAHGVALWLKIVQAGNRLIYVNLTRAFADMPAGYSHAFLKYLTSRTVRIMNNNEQYLPNSKVQD